MHGYNPVEWEKRQCRVPTLMKHSLLEVCMNISLDFLFKTKCRPSECKDLQSRSSHPGIKLLFQNKYLFDRSIHG